MPITKPMPTNDIRSAELIRYEIATRATPPTKGPVALCRLP